MPDALPIPRGPEGFENSLHEARLSDREADAVRTVVLGMTANEAAPLIGVSASTVGSYRQRAYQKLGVTTKSEFLALPGYALWRESLSSQIALPDEGDLKECDPKEAFCVEREKQPLNVPRLFLASLVAAFLIVSLFVVATVLLRPSYRYVDSPNGAIASEYGEVPNVVGMRADAAASTLASSGYLPEFKSCASSDAPGTVLRVVEVGDVRDASEEFSSVKWDGGSASGYNRYGNWSAFVLLEVAV